MGARLLTIRGGFDRARPGSDIVSFVTDELTLSRGDVSAVMVAADVAVRLTPRAAVTGELRYQWAKSALGRDFAAFERIDLSGFAVTGGTSGTTSSPGTSSSGDRTAHPHS